MRELDEALSADSYLEHAFLRWVLRPAVRRDIVPFVAPQKVVVVGEREYRIDCALEGRTRVAVELDGFEWHGDRAAFSYDRLRQNDLHAAGWTTLRFSYDSIRRETRRCVAQLQALLARDTVLSAFLIPDPAIETPQMEPDSIWSLAPSPAKPSSTFGYFDAARQKLNLQTLRVCQKDAFAALASYYSSGSTRAACIMSVGAGKTSLGVAACLGFARRRALIVTPGSVIRGTFDRALDAQAIGNTLNGLSGGPLLPGCPPPRVRTLDRYEGSIRDVSREELLQSHVIVTNFHSLGSGEEGDLLSKLRPGDVDFILVDEAHIAAADSYQRMFRHFPDARTLLVSACFQRLDGKPLDADVVYRYRLIDSIAEGHAKNLRVRRFTPEAEETTYEIIWPDGTREEVIGREALLELVKDARKLSRIVAKSDASIRRVMSVAKDALDEQAKALEVRPRILFSALGKRHAEQIARIAEEVGIPCATLHHTMSEGRIRTTRERYESESGDVQGIVQLKMLGQGYDFPPICVVVPLRPYGSFGEFYQFIGRGIRVVPQRGGLANETAPLQLLDIIYHADLGLDEHIEAIYHENDMDLAPHSAPSEEAGADISQTSLTSADSFELPSSASATGAGHLEAFVLFEPGTVERRVVHDESRVEQRRLEREQEALAQRYAVYAASTSNPLPFAQFVQVMKEFRV